MNNTIRDNYDTTFDVFYASKIINLAVIMNIFIIIRIPIAQLFAVTKNNTYRGRYLLMIQYFLMLTKENNCMQCFCFINHNKVHGLGKS